MHPDGDFAGLAAAQEVRQAAVWKCLTLQLVFVPMPAGFHWTLLVLQKTNACNWTCRYYDSLTVESDICRERAQEVLNRISMEVGELQLPARENTAFQLKGSNTCGCFVLHWMEQEVRQHVLKESPCSAGWPESKQWATRLHRLGGLLQSERLKLQNEEKAAAALEEKLGELRAAAKEKPVAMVKLNDLLKKLAKDALLAGTKQPHGKPCYENLSPAAKEALEKIKNYGIGLCSRCHWSTGCLSCDYEKALKYLLKKEFPGPLVASLISFNCNS